MTDLNLPPAPPPAPPPQATPPTGTPGRGMRIALAVSLALNLGVAGLVGGLLFEGGPRGRSEIVRDLGFGPFDEALRPEDRDVLRKAMQSRSGDLRAAGDQMRSDAVSILGALRAVPFDKVALTAALQGQEQHLTARLKLGNAVFGDFLAGLSDQVRIAFADRYEHHLKRPKGDAPVAQMSVKRQCEFY